MFTEAYYYFPAGGPITPTYEQVFSLETEYNLTDYIDTTVGEFDPIACDAECAEACRKKRENGEIKQHPQNYLDWAAANNRVLREGQCFYRIEDGQANIPENRTLVCGCFPLEE